MVKLLIGLLEFLRTCAPLLTSLIILTILCILLSKSIKKYATVYYIILGIPFLLIAIPSIGRMFGAETGSFVTIPFLGEIIRDYIHMGTFGHPLLIIIMYMGALDPKTPNVKKLLTIRKELSIISGFAVFAHSLIRVINNVPSSFKFFTNNADYMANTRVASELGAGISSFSFILGILMLILFIPLWVTSFDSVRKRMGNVKWKKLQKWSYVLYATLFIHAVGIQVGGMLNPRGGGASKPATEVTVAANVQHGQRENARPAANNEQPEQSAKPATGGHDGRNGENIGQTTGGGNAQTAKPATGGGRMPSKGFADITVSAQAKQYIHLLSLFLIYGSYLYLRLRKAKKDALRKSKAKEMHA